MNRKSISSSNPRERCLASFRPIVAVSMATAPASGNVFCPLSDAFQRQVTVIHYPAGARKRNPVEHIFFGVISCSRAGRPLECRKAILNYIRTNNKSELKADTVRVDT